MRSRNFGNSQRLTGIFRLCLCLAVAGIIILGAADRTTAASSAAGSLPVINVFSSDPLTLKDGDSALYTFEVSGSTDMKVVENGVTIKEIHSPPNTTLKGTVRGNKTSEIQTGHITTFDTTLEAMNASGGQVKTLTLSFATAPKAKSLILPAGQRGSDNRTPKWGPETYTKVASSITSTITQAPWPPHFAQCTPPCGNCLRPRDAAARGLTRKCSDQPCYYSPDEKEYWYCYSSNPVSVQVVRRCWHCVGGQATEVDLQGTDNCSSANLYSNQADAQQHCQQCWYCQGGQVSQTPYYSDTGPAPTCYSSQSAAATACQQSSACWYCVGGQATQTLPNGYHSPCYPTQAKATALCAGTTNASTCYRCVGGQVSQGGPPSDFPCYPTWDQANSACQMCYCCQNGNVMHILQTACQQIGGTCYSSPSAAAGCATPPTAPTTPSSATPAPAPCYCCNGGQGTYTNQAACAQVGGTCYSSQSAANGCATFTGTIAYPEQPMCYCCNGGQVTYTTQAACTQAGGNCNSNRSAALERCTSTTHHLTLPNKNIIPNLLPVTPMIPTTPTIK